MIDGLQVLVIVAASHLDAVTFQICSQSFKIMPTALFAVWLLGQYLTPMQWASLPVLAVGVVLVTMNGSAGELCICCVLHMIVVRTMVGQVLILTLRLIYYFPCLCGQVDLSLDAVSLVASAKRQVAAALQNTP